MSRLTTCGNPSGTGKLGSSVLRHKSLTVQLAVWIHGFHILGFNQLQFKNIFEKLPESSKKQNLNLLLTGNDLPSINIVLGGTGHLEVKCAGGCRR